MTTDLSGIYLDLDGIPRLADGSDVPTRTATTYIGALTKLIARRAEKPEQVQPSLRLPGAESKTRFIAPTKIEVELHFKNLGMNGSAEAEATKFISYYDARGWMMGKNKMKKWKSAASGWAIRYREHHPAVAQPDKKELWKQWLKSNGIPFVEYGQGNEMQKARFDRELAAGKITK